MGEIGSEFDPAQLSRALDYSSDIVVITDIQGNIQYVNKTFEKKYGYSKTEIIGKNTRILDSGYHDAVFYQNLWNTILAGETWKGLFKNQTRDRQIIWEKATINPIRNTLNKITGFIAIKEDITHQLKLESQLESDRFFLEKLFTNAPVGIVILEPIYINGKIKDLIVLKANPTAGNIVNKLGLVGLSVRRALPEFTISKQKVEQMLSRKDSFETYLPTLNKHLRLRSFPFGENRLCVFFYDVTAYKQTIAALEASEKRYFSLVEDAPALICRFNKEGVLSYVNNQYCKFFNLTPKELIGKSFLDFLHDADKETTRQHIESLTVDSPINEYEHRVILDSGEIRWQQWIDRALIDTNGNIFEYQSVGMDLTRLKEVEEALIIHRNKLDTVINNTVVGIGVVDLNGQYKLVNDRFVKLMGYNYPEEIYQLTNIHLTHPEFIDSSLQKLQDLISGKISEYNIEKKFIRRDGSEFWGDLYASPIKSENGEITELVGIVTDISQRKKMELELLENEAKLKKLNATKDKLFSIIAHDIKNPFNAILGFASLLKNNYEDYNSEEIKELIHELSNASENVYKLLEDLLLWGKSQLGHIKARPQNITLNELVAQAFNHFNVHAQDKNIRLINEIPNHIAVFADYEMLRFVLRNLIHNSIKFTPKDGGTITCSASTNTNTHQTIIKISDTGIGIQKEKLNSLFDITKRFETTGTLAEKGTGLGLHLTREMITLNKGQIQVKSIVNKGTTFTIYLPFLNEN
ncbi:PAS domain S-box protein [Marinilabiliaceae bacterium JC017]|nr:PAS domain S-box protein [Marinilabiliaceae bacterium JC017]